MPRFKTRVNGRNYCVIVSNLLRDRLAHAQGVTGQDPETIIRDALEWAKLNGKHLNPPGIKQAISLHLLYNFNC